MACFYGRDAIKIRQKENIHLPGCRAWLTNGCASILSSGSRILEPSTPEMQLTLYPGGLKAWLCMASPVEVEVHFIFLSVHGLIFRAATIRGCIGQPRYFFQRYEDRYLSKISRYYDTIKYATSTNLGNHCL